MKLRRRISAGLFAAALAVFVCGCPFHVTEGYPRPNIALQPQGATLGLAFGSAVPDAFDIPTQNGIKGGHVEGWRATLRNGYLYGFKEAFKLAAEQPADVTIVIDDAELEFVPTGVAGSAVMAGTAQVRYKAKLVDKNGATLRLAAGTAAAKKSSTSRGEVTVLAASAIETMYEQLAQELFQGGPPKG